MTELRLAQGFQTIGDAPCSKLLQLQTLMNEHAMLQCTWLCQPGIMLALLLSEELS
jgi:hypothetical protein